MSSAGKLVSVIIPVYNVRPFLSECLSSVLAQTHVCFECICVDDGSSDGSGTILDDFAKADNRIKVIHQANAGVSVARNKALDAVCGEFVTFLDSDDMFSPDFLEKAVRAFHDDPKLDLWVGQVVKVTEDNHEYPLEEQAKGPPKCHTEHVLQDFLRFPCRQYLFSICPKVYRTSVITEHKLRFALGISNGEDSLFMTKLFSCLDRAVIDDSIVYRRRMRRGSLVSRSWANQVDDLFYAIFDLENFSKESPRRRIVEVAVAQRALARLHVLLSQGYSREFMDEYVRALCRNKNFRMAVCRPIVKWAPIMYRFPALVMFALPKRVTELILRMIPRVIGSLK